MNTVFSEDVRILNESLEAVNINDINALVEDCMTTYERGGKIIASGLGKNVPICEKFVGTMTSMGLRANFMHTNSAVHGDMGMIEPGDLLILLTKSGETYESVYLVNLLMSRIKDIWLLTFNDNSTLAHIIPKKIVLSLEHEGDLWDIVPNNSSILNLIVLQKISILLAKRKNILLSDFKKNHPGGHIGVTLKNLDRN